MHVIRLRHPWQRDWYSEAQSPTAATEPADYPTAPWARYQRSFNRPSGLLPKQAVWLVIEPQRPPNEAAQEGCQLVALKSLQLNAISLELVAADRGLRAQVAAELLPFNRLEILCELSQQPNLPPELAELMEVRLEIDSS